MQLEQLKQLQEKFPKTYAELLEFYPLLKLGYMPFNTPGDLDNHIRKGLIEDFLLSKGVWIYTKPCLSTKEICCWEYYCVEISTHKNYTDFDYDSYNDAFFSGVERAFKILEGK